MDSPIERRLDAHLTRIIDQIRQIRQLNMTDTTDREKALQESLEALRALTVYRGVLKNVGEHHFSDAKEVPPPDAADTTDP